MIAALAPYASTAARLIVVAGVAYAIGQRRARPRPEAEEAALDAVPEGLDGDIGREGQGVRASLAGRSRGYVSALKGLPKLRYDVSLLGRIRLNRVD
ncbi:MAG: hypothetical protein AAFQ36_08825 [Pseudomonadota bacterium]